MKLTHAALFSGLCCVLAFAAPRPASADLLAHRAVYELKLVKTTGQNAPAAVNGLIAYDFSGSACEGYTTNFRQMIELSAAEGDVHVTDVRSSTFEDAGYKNFRFKVNTLNDGVASEQVDGAASHKADGGLVVHLTQPKSAQFDFSAGILFPTEHMEKIIAAAKAGETTLTRQIYDGSDNGDKIFDTLTVIGKVVTGAKGSFADTQDALKTVQRWPVVISYFEVGKNSDQPSYVLSFDLYENGVSRDMKLDYGDFVMKGEMTQFSAEPSSAPCGK